MNPDSKNVARRLALESAVIIASILAAFALDTWWDNTQERREERQTLVALRGEFSTARETIERYRRDHERVLLSLTSIVDSLDRALDRGSETVSLPDTALAWIYVPPTTSVSLGTLQGLVSSGRLGILSDLELRTALGSWGHELAELTEEEIDARNLVYGDLDRAFRARTNTYGLWSMADSLLRGTLGPGARTAVRTIPADRELLGVIQLRLNLSRHGLTEFEPLLEAVDTILRLIDRSL